MVKSTMNANIDPLFDVFASSASRAYSILTYINPIIFGFVSSTYSQGAEAKFDV
jgi:hypothetical protein